MTRTCSDCPRQITDQSKTGRCRSCAARRSLADPAIRERRMAGLRKAKRSPEHRATASQASIRMHAERAGDPSWQAYKVASGMRLREHYEQSPEAQAANLAKREQAGRAHTDRALAFCPPELRPQYRRWRSQHGQAMARAMVDALLADIEKARIAALSPFERQMERLRNGAQLIEVRPMRRADHDFTLGGVATGML